MWAYVVRRTMVGVVLLLAVSFVTFFLFFASPVDAARYACGKNCTEAQRDQVRKALGYDEAWYAQWGDFVKGTVAGRVYPADPELRAAAPEVVTKCEAPCMGYSHLNSETVNSLIGEYAPVTIALGLVAMVMWLVGGVLFGILAAVFKGSFLDRAIVGVTLLAFAFPTFFIGVFFLKYLAIKWSIIPFPSYVSIESGGLWQWLLNLLVPAFTLALVFTAGYVRMTRAFVIESMSEDYIRTARSKGLNNRIVLFKHGLRAALTPLVTMTGLDLATLLGGAIITESVFAYPGLGLLTVQASNAWDLPTIIGIVVLSAAFVVVANILVDISYAFIDPRVRLG